MKRIVAYMLFLIFLCMLIPIIFTNRRIEKVNGKLVENEEVKQEQPKEEYSYKQYGTIKLLHEKTSEKRCDQSSGHVSDSRRCVWVVVSFSHR